MLNQIMPQLLQSLNGGHDVTVTEGWQTKKSRELHVIPKTHAADAYCIACDALDHQTVFAAPDEPFDVKQYRRHDRAGIRAQTQRTYRLDRKIVARNRHKAEGQTEDSLCEWYQKTLSEYGRKTADVMRSRLAVSKSSRRYNNLKCVMPGTVLLCGGKRHILRGQQNQGRRYMFEDMKRGDGPAYAKDCTIMSGNTGLVFL